MQDRQLFSYSGACGVLPEPCQCILNTSSYRLSPVASNVVELRSAYPRAPLKRETIVVGTGNGILPGRHGSTLYGPVSGHAIWNESLDISTR
jgi:hypothetical protein